MLGSSVAGAGADSEERLEVHEAIEALVTKRWTKVVRGILRLAHLRRLWGVLGNWLREVKRRGVADHR